MKQLTTMQSACMACGALMMVIGVGLMVFGMMKTVPPLVFIFVLGSVMFAAMQMMQTYTGPNFRIKRLRRIMVFGDICFILSALLMLENVYHWLFPFFARTIDGYNAYVHYIYNNWVVLLLIGAVIEIYTTHRIASEMKKEM